MRLIALENADMLTSFSKLQFLPRSEKYYKIYLENIQREGIALCKISRCEIISEIKISFFLNISAILTLMHKQISRLQKITFVHIVNLSISI